jgi:hypothetical protein
MFKTVTLLVTLSFLTIFTTAQNLFSAKIENRSFAAAGNEMPFWFCANQHGKIIHSNTLLNLSDVSIRKSYGKDTDSAISYTWGVNLVAALGEENYFQLNRAFGGILWKGWELKGGMFYNPLRYGGLSTTNGNLARSGNSRPWPMLRLSTPEFKPVPFTKNRLSFKAEYEEGILNDQRFVKNARQHHKSLYLKVEPALSWKIRAGFEHFVMWGGTSQDNRIGKMPLGFKDYLQYVLATSGDEDFPEMDQLNIAGDQFGTYQLEIVKHFSTLEATFYLSHPFEDFSGINWRNWPDNLMGLHVSFNNKQKWITDVVYEYTNTRQQSIRDSFYVFNEESGGWVRQENDNYFTHGLYQSGFTYHQMVIASPLFFPVQLDEKGKPTGFRAIKSTRFYSHHFGMKGFLSKHFHWKGKVTWMHHFGSYLFPYEPSEKQLSSLLEMQYINPEFPVEMGIAAGADMGNTINTNLGFQFWVTKRW